MTKPEDLKTLDVLSRYTGKSVYLYEVSGNNGDELILKGSDVLIEQAGCKRASSPEDADALLINGGFKSDFWPFANEKIVEFSEQFPSKPLIILPSSFLFETTDFPSFFAGRTAPVTIMARERPSLKILQAMNFDCETEFGLDHDTAFALADSAYYAELRKRVPIRDLLIVERGDAERVSDMAEDGLLDSSLLKGIARRVLPRSGLNLAAKMVGKARRRSSTDAQTVFAQAATLQAQSSLGRTPEKMLVADVSRRSCCSFEEFCEEIADSEVVVSTRLHVAILAAVLGRRTFIVSGKYHKIPGIYEFSMSDMDHVSMVDAHCELIS